ncbi:hypothetical protein [Riemerella anatipestifer]|uniref:hypothetical protein n=1 Tax=Riemerella anatipestifer TaxID=34085 RepID=UPI00208F36EC|nr:hypothetical protein [Riemerella anatipestifer]MCO4303725.1 hypothetical protein [Riemerella anatipestifer]MCO7352092.1 hypothetical protein [Riemerella anatipestifer]MCQ4039733.1 hypothetical protein [Riemerella anatipestifer]MCT6760605.1 hypothetical protein [Riemerella anatipestifer]MCT6764323.1 hypothetical protein [Riemerella anatipestifer]
MTNLNDHLNIPENLKGIVEQINNIPLHLAELKIEDHPDYPSYNRTIKVLRMETTAEVEYCHFVYEQILTHKETKTILNIQLPKPIWEVNMYIWSYFRGKDGQPVELPLKEDYEAGEDENIFTKLRVPAYKYMLWLMTNNHANFLQLIEGYLGDFVRIKINELNGR